MGNLNFGQKSNFVFQILVKIDAVFTRWTFVHNLLPNLFLRLRNLEMGTFAFFQL